jgi:chemotaxis protein MotB
MAKQKIPEPEKDNAERWLLTYSDMITLLLALFIMLYAMSTIDAVKYAQIAESIAGAFEGGSGELPDIGSGPVGESPVDGAEADQPASFSELYNMLQEQVQDNSLQDVIELIQNDDSIIVRFKDFVLFYPDSAQMSPAGQEVLASIGNILSEMSPTIGHIQIGGHTAEVGPETVNGFQLSAARAVAVLIYLTNNELFPQSKTEVVGYSHYVPLAENDTEEGRSRNRRVELLITPPPEIDWDSLLP